MVRLFIISFTYENIACSAKVIEYHLSPSFFYVTLDEAGTANLPTIIFHTKSGKLELAQDSPKIDPSLEKVIAEELQMNIKE
jgi:hypothetical protein